MNKTLFLICSLTISNSLFARSNDPGTAIGIAVIGFIFISVLFWIINQVKSKAQDFKAGQKLSSSNNAVELFQTGVYYFNKNDYKRALEFANKSLSINDKYVDAKKLQLSSLEYLEDYFGYEKEATHIVTKASPEAYRFNETLKDSYTPKEQASVFFNISKAKKLNGNLSEGNELRDIAINLNPFYKTEKW